MVATAELRVARAPVLDSQIPDSDPVGVVSKVRRCAPSQAMGCMPRSLGDLTADLL